MIKIANKIKNKLLEILNYYGEELQQGQMREEMMELDVAIKKKDRENYIEELADVFIVSLQLIMALKKNEKTKFKNIMNYKIERTLKKIEKKEEGKRWQK